MTWKEETVIKKIRNQTVLSQSQWLKLSEVNLFWVCLSWGEKGVQG